MSTETSVDLPNPAAGEATNTRSIGLPWRRYRISLFWRFGIKVTRPSRTVALQQAQVPNTESPRSNKDGPRPTTLAAPGLAAYACERSAP
jgi:hypothetical protein